MSETKQIERPLAILRDLVEDPKNNGDYKLALEGDELRRLWFSTEELERESDALRRELDEAKTKQGHQHQLLRSIFYAADFYKQDNGYRLQKLMSCTDNGKEVLLQLDERDKLKAQLAAAQKEIEELKRAISEHHAAKYHNEGSAMFDEIGTNCLACAAIAQAKAHA